MREGDAAELPGSPRSTRMFAVDEPNRIPAMSHYQFTDTLRAQMSPVGISSTWPPSPSQAPFLTPKELFGAGGHDA
jgi:hypothetical protein